MEAVGRKGKHFWLELDRRPWPAFHFGMSGSLRVYGDASERPRYWKLELQSEDGARLAIRDPRRLGRIRLLRDPAREPPISRLGFDVLEEMPGPRQLHGLLSRRRGPIKAVLLDQGLFAGVGNWIADEALYQARISPHRPAASLKPAEVARLRRRLAAIVVLAVRVLAAAPGTTITCGFRGAFMNAISDGDNVNSRPLTVQQNIPTSATSGATTAWFSMVPAWHLTEKEM